MGDVFGIGGIAQAGSNAAVAALNYKAQSDYNQKYLQGVQETNQLNERLSHEQNEWNLAQWNRENEYNDPAAQGQRLRNAGLSAAAAAQQVSGGQASPLQSADLSVAQAPQPLQAPQLDVSGINIIGIARALEDLKQSKITSESMQNDLDFQPGKLFTEQQVREQTLLGLKQDYEFNANANQYRLRGYMYDNEMKLVTIKKERIMRNIAKYNLKQARENFSFLKEMHGKQIAQATQDLANSIKDFEYKQVQISNAKKQGALFDKQGKQMDLDFARDKVKAAFDKYGGVPDDFVSRMAVLICEGVVTPETLEKNGEYLKEIGNYVNSGMSANLSEGAVNFLYDFLEGLASPFMPNDDLGGLPPIFVRALGKRFKKKQSKSQ